MPRTFFPLFIYTSMDLPYLFIYLFIYLYIDVFLTFYFSPLLFYHLCTFILDYSVVMGRNGFKFGLFTVLVIAMLTKMGFDTWSFAV